jgi:hypothetical protein
MKITPLLTSLLLALSLTGAAHAKVHTAPAAPNAAATIEAEKCVPNAASSCMTDDGWRKLGCAFRAVAQGVAISNIRALCY